MAMIRQTKNCFIKPLTFNTPPKVCYTSRWKSFFGLYSQELISSAVSEGGLGLVPGLVKSGTVLPTTRHNNENIMT